MKNEVDKIIGNLILNTDFFISALRYVIQENDEDQPFSTENHAPVIGRGK